MFHTLTKGFCSKCGGRVHYVRLDKPHSGGHSYSWIHDNPARAYLEGFHFAAVYALDEADL